MPSSSPPASANGHWILTGLAGRGIGESRTPWMHEREASAQGLRMAYSKFDFTQRGWDDDYLAELLRGAELSGFAGLNVTLPFKQAVIPLLDELSNSARLIGAANTVSFAHGKRTGYNTDVTGFARSMSEGLPDAARNLVVQIGCGGAGAATAHALLSDLGVEMLLLSDNCAERAADLCSKLTETYGKGRARVIDAVEPALSEADGVLNATPMGMAKFPGIPLRPEALDARHWVAEIIYFPLETELLKHARAIGCRTLDGSRMAIQQAADAFKIFTGHEASSARMRESFSAFSD